MMFDTEEDILVALTTTKFLLNTDAPFWKTYVTENIPICLAEMRLGISDINPSNKEKAELFIAETMKAMLKRVSIDVEKHTVFFGDDPDVFDSSLVWYAAQFMHECETEFFIRWTETKSVLFELQVFTMETPKKVRFTVYGVYFSGSWKRLNIDCTGRFTVIPTFSKS